MDRLLAIMRRLRGPGGCPWDQQQTHDSLRSHLLEEAAEAADAIAAGDPRELADELGDVLLQVAFHAVIGEEEGTFGYGDVESAIVDKLVRRHPHVFGDVEVDDAAHVLRNWQAIKAEERGGVARSAAERMPRSLPALRRAGDLARRSAGRSTGRWQPARWATWPAIPMAWPPGWRCWPRPPRRPATTPNCCCATTSRGERARSPPGGTPRTRTAEAAGA
jgi:uncharacterized protein YabN with tetrapyrrole methylase and pyrophosphatase domain